MGSFLLVISIFGVVAIAALAVHKRYFSKHNLRDAIILYKKPHYYNARELFEEISAKDNRNAAIYWLMARCSLEIGESSRAISELKKVIQINDFTFEEEHADLFQDFSEIGVHKLLRDIYKKSGQQDLAFQQNQILMRLDPQNTEYPMQVAMELINNGELSDRTTGFLQAAIDIDEDFADAYVWLSYIYLKNEDYKKAEGYTSKALDINNSLVDGRYFKGELLRRSNQPTAAIEYLESATTSPNFQKSAAFGLARIYFEQNDSGNAETWAFKADAAPKSPYENEMLEWDVKYYLAKILEHLNRFSKAKELYTVIHDHMPDYKDVASKLNELGSNEEGEYVKDFITAKSDLFLRISEQVVNEMGYSVLKAELASDGGITMRAKGTGISPTVYGVFVRRNYDLVNEDQLKKLKMYVETSRCDIGIFINTGDFTNTAKDFAFKHKIKIINREELDTILARVMKSKV